MLPTGMVQMKAPVLVHRRIAKDHFLMRLKAPLIAQRAIAGQFIHLSCLAETKRGLTPRGQTPLLLRRPFSLLDVNPAAGTIDFIYKIVGKGTTVLAEALVGSKLDLLGPLGRPFAVPSKLKSAYLVGGGVGIPPLYLLAKEILRKQKGLAAEEIQVFLGARTKEWVICARMFRALGGEVRVATDDGTLGFQGSVVDLVEEHLRMLSSRKRTSDSRFRGNDNGMLYICGPTPMMAAAAAVAREHKLQAQVSLEERMGCAMGCCMGCVVEVTTEPAASHARFQRVCTEGPVFPAGEIAWRE